MDSDHTKEDVYECPECEGSVGLTKEGMFHCENDCDLSGYVECDECGEVLVGLPERVCIDCGGEEE